MTDELRDKIREWLASVGHEYDATTDLPHHLERLLRSVATQRRLRVHGYTDTDCIRAALAKQKERDDADG
jgi:hypothetical protein